MTRPVCRFRDCCGALATQDSPFCTIHQPDKIMDRVENIVFNHFAPVIAASDAVTAVLLKRVYDHLRQDLQETV